MFVSLWDEFVLFSYQKIRLSYDKDTHRPTFRYVYTLSGFLLFLQKQRKPFGKWVVPLAILSKTLLCDSSGMVAQSKRTEVPLEEKMHKKEVSSYCDILQRGNMTCGVESFYDTQSAFGVSGSLLGLSPKRQDMI